MKNKKLKLPTVILATALLIIAVYAFVNVIALKPTVTEGAFPFSITYEMNGEEVTVNDVYYANYHSTGGFANSKQRIYEGKIDSLPEGEILYTLYEDGKGSVLLSTKLYPSYLMGDPTYDYYSDDEFAPEILYYDFAENDYADEETVLAMGFKIINYEYPTPIENSLVFSHISYLDSDNTVPMLLVAMVALLAIAIFVRKEKELKYKVLEKISIVFNILIFITFVPFVSFLALLLDIEGGGPEFYYQALYYLPSLSVMCIAASVALRRKGYGKTALVSGFIGPLAFALYLIIFLTFGVI